MSQVGDALRLKNKRQKQRIERRKSELNKLRQRATYQAKLVQALESMDELLDSGEVESVKIEVPKEYIDKFSGEIYRDTLAEYDIQQDENNPLEFHIKRKYIAL